MTTEQWLLCMGLFFSGTLFLLNGIMLGWIGAERYIAFLAKTRHEYEELFEQNPHPELYNDKGEIIRNDYIAITFEPGFDPEAGGTIELIDEDEED